MILTVNLQRAIQMHMMKVINVDMMMGGLERTMLILILRLQQVLALVRQQVVVNIMAISIKIAQQQVLALVRQQVVVMATIKMPQRRVLAQQLLLAAEMPQQQVLALVQPLVVDQQQQVQAKLNSIKSIPIPIPSDGYLPAV
jgi:hypothetical protein